MRRHPIFEIRLVNEGLENEFFHKIIIKKGFSIIDEVVEILLVGSVVFNSRNLSHGKISSNIYINNNKVDVRTRHYDTAKRFSGFGAEITALNSGYIMAIEDYRLKSTIVFEEGGFLERSSTN